ncbi:hypothetical protein [Aliivibrio fischeri]|uniref:hypothetical protein n=1 Tax=Aliivibrio fischeri TaxID=668 RepID=UPI0012DACB0C|nr:hypothetical protein [Aliivibrio fischeri]MUK70158.1 hypothetical protein [Aliivibrio fischeri]MUK72692.1 hypothetical protein [Aliivibrio fischeri]
MNEDEIAAYLDGIREEHEENTFFFQHNLGADVQCFFAQGLSALKAELYLAACSSFIIGIEASLRITQAQIETPVVINELDPIKTLSNRLLNDAGNNELPINLLAFPEEDDFFEKLNSIGQNRRNVEIVRIRHDLCHGNILEHRNSELGDGNIIFTPECVRDLSMNLYQISRKWAEGLGEFRVNRFNLSQS